MSELWHSMVMKGILSDKEVTRTVGYAKVGGAYTKLWSVLCYVHSTVYAGLCVGP